jgi:uncharacterized protein
MKVLITGATGLVGKKLVKKLLQEKIEVHYLSTSKLKLKNKLFYTGFYWNPREGKIDDKAFNGVDAIIHLAGANIAQRWTSVYKKEVLDSRVLSSNLLFETLKRIPNQVKQVISASGTAIYPDSFDKIYTESETQIAPGFLSDVVVQWEQSISQIEALNIKVCKLRTGIVYAKKGGALPEIIKPIRWGFGASFGSGKQIQSWIHIQDLVGIYYLFLINNKQGIYNAIAPETVSDQKLTKIIAQKLRKPLFMPNIPRFIMQLILGDMCELLFTNKNISSQKIINEGYSYKFPNIEKAIGDILK